MSTLFSSVNFPTPSDHPDAANAEQAALVNGEVLLKTYPHSAWGGAVVAQMYLPLGRSQVWQQVTDYPRWVQYFPDVVRSEVVTWGNQGQGVKRLYQVANKAFLLFKAQVEVYLRVMETAQQTTQHHIQFRLERGSFSEFTAELTLKDLGVGTLLTYSVQATPTIPVPTLLIQEAMRLDLPANMRKMRQVLCQS